ncbi:MULTISPECIES: Rieske (2Fe-2S) protein [unclassified Streptomyces]|uniref:Rieske (2Fe-2S) protein n=1 Tax=unclassified Streptomyces TaxID=2593676 RepID=UPI001908E31D|nr:Rieske (2Fe-2S) protein [Streptomyces sp. HSG2]
MTSTPLQPGTGPARRTVVAAAGVAGIAAALSACSGADSGTAQGSGVVEESNGASAEAGSGTEGSAAAPLASVSDIPEGGGKVFPDRKVVVTQPVAGDFKAFSATCTHQGCAVKSVADGVINCPCHDSNFSATDGSVRSGPATEPLPAVRITVTGDSIALA